MLRRTSRKREKVDYVALNSPRKRERLQEQLGSGAARRPGKRRRARTIAGAAPRAPSEGDDDLPLQERLRRRRVRVRSLISRIRREQIVPRTELRRVRLRIRTLKEALRSVVATIEDLHGDTKPIPDEAYDSDGLAEEHMLCSMCGTSNVSEDNDIVLCDGIGCNRAFHFRCASVTAVEVTESEDWFCAVCDCKIDCVDLVNEEFGTSYAGWSEMFRESASCGEERDALASLLEGYDSADDSDYDPDATGGQSSFAPSLSSQHMPSGRPTRRTARNSGYCRRAEELRNLSSPDSSDGESSSDDQSESDSSAPSGSSDGGRQPATSNNSPSLRRISRVRRRSYCADEDLSSRGSGSGSKHVLAAHSARVLRRTRASRMPATGSGDDSLPDESAEESMSTAASDSSSAESDQNGSGTDKMQAGDSLTMLLAGDALEYDDESSDEDYVPS